jgi:hypothetical protein
MASAPAPSWGVHGPPDPQDAPDPPDLGAPGPSGTPQTPWTSGTPHEIRTWFKDKFEKLADTLFFKTFSNELRGVHQIRQELSVSDSKD